MPTNVEAELRRRDGAGELVDWSLVADPTSETGLADPVSDVVARDRLKTIMLALADQFTAGDEVTLTAAQVADLKQVVAAVSGTVDVANLPATYPDGHAQPLTDAELRAAPVTVDTGLAQPVQDGGEVRVSNDPAAIALQASTATIDSSTPMTITPAAGNALRLWWVSAIADPDNATSPSVRVALGATEVYRAPAVAHRQRFDGAADQTLTVTVVGTGDVDVTIHYEEFAP